MDLNDLAKNPEQIQSLISLLQGLLDTQSTTNKNNKKEKQKEEKSEEIFNSKIKTRGSQKRSKQSVNKFDKMSEFRMHKDDVKVDQALSKHPPVARIREFDPVDVVCRVCGKKETVNPSLVFDSVSRYKCNNCSTQSG